MPVIYDAKVFLLSYGSVEIVLRNSELVRKLNSVLMAETGNH